MYGPSACVVHAESPLRPFLKWPGGKRWLFRYAAQFLRGVSYERYFEPFLGGGALYFALRPPKAFLSDINPDLINAYEQVRRDPCGLIRDLKRLPVDRATYDHMRRTSPETAAAKAVRFLYLNRTAFGGMYRLNRDGQFNVPFGGGQRTPAPLWTENLLTTASEALRTAHLFCGDFEEALSLVRCGDLVYCDPTYTVAHNNNGFVRYNERNFSWDDQKRLARICRNLRRRGATILVSNAAHDEIIDLYGADGVHLLHRASTLCPRSDKRRRTTEVLLVFCK